MPSQSCSTDPDHRLVGDPVDTLTGAVFDRKLEFRLTGPLEFRWYRHYDSSLNEKPLACGWGHTHDFYRELRFEGESMVYEGPVGRRVVFPRLAADGDEIARNGFVFRRLTELKYHVFQYGEPSMEFEFRPPRQRARLGRLFQGKDQIQFRYDEAQRLQRIIDSLGRNILVVEDADGRMISLTLEARSNETPSLLVSYHYDQRGNLVATKNGSGHGYAFVYDAANRMLMRRGRKGFKFSFEYDAQGRCIKATGDDKLYGVTVTYVVPRRVTKVRRADDGEWVYTFDAAGGLTTIRDPLGGVQKFLRDETGQVVLELDANSNPTSIAYDRTGIPTAKTTPLGHRIALPENPNAADPLGHRVPANPAEYEYGRLLDTAAIRLPSRQEVAALSLSGEAALLVTTSDEGPKSQENAKTFEVRPLGVLWWPAPKIGRIFNEFGKLVGQRDEFGRQRQWTYDASGNVSEYTDFDGKKWSYDNGTWHLLKAVVDPLGAMVRFSYTTNAQVASCIDAGGTISEYRYDLNDHLVEIKRHGVIRDTYQRDSVGNLVGKRAGDGRELLQIEVGPGNLPIKRVLASGDEHSFRYNKSGRPLEAKTKNDRLDFAYDSLGNTLIEKRNGLGVQHRFQGWGNPAESLFFKKFSARFEWINGRCLIVVDPTGKSHEIRFHGYGLVERRLSNGSKETSQYDNFGRCLFKCAQLKNGRVWSRSYHWSGEGELHRVKDNIQGEIRHEYDVAHRLRRRSFGARVESYEMDPAGNLLWQTRLHSISQKSGNRLAAVDGFPVSYNDRDHLAMMESEEGTVRYTYDSRDQLIGMEGPRGVWSAEYDTSNRRTRKRWAGQTTEYYWNGDQLMAEVAPGGRLRLYLYADPLAMTPILFLDYDALSATADSGRRYFVFSDQIGTPYSIEDDSGAEVWRAWIDPYGYAEVLPGSSIEFNLRFPGHYFDPETKLNYNRFRYYDPRLGRYLQSDPWGIAGGYNLYAYRSNPLLEVDVRGLGEENTKKGKPCPDEEGDLPLDKRKGWVEEYGEQKKITGDGSVDRDHQPSKLAIKKAIKDDIDARVAAGEMEPPTPEQMKEINKRIDNEALSVVVDHDVHKDGPTYGSQNKAQSEIDKKDLGAAAARDADTMVANTAKTDPDALPATQAAADKIKEQTHESIMEKNRAIVDDVMNSDD